MERARDVSETSVCVLRVFHGRGPSFFGFGFLVLNEEFSRPKFGRAASPFFARSLRAKSSLFFCPRSLVALSLIPPRGLDVRHVFIPGIAVIRTVFVFRICVHSICFFGTVTVSRPSTCVASAVSRCVSRGRRTDHAKRHGPSPLIFSSRPPTTHSASRRRASRRARQA